ncbi:MAG: FtsW/RodA/SpoVE family cell cycle protein [Candidatus Limnocylindrales bacterium]
MTSFGLAAPARAGSRTAAGRLRGAAAGIRPRRRGQETALLVAAAAALAVGWLGLATTEADRLTIGDPSLLVIYLVVAVSIHGLFIVTGRRTDQVLFPVVVLLGGISLLFMARLPPDLVTQQLGPFGLLTLAPLQLLWLTLSLGTIGVLAVVARNDSWLRSYKYTWAAAGVSLLVLVFLFGQEVNGVRLTLRLGPLAGQPSELLKIILVVFLAGYLAENRALLAATSLRLGPLDLPPLPYLLPMLAMWGIALAVVVVQRDLGAALLFFAVFLCLLYIATQRRSYVVFGLLLAVVGSIVLYAVEATVRVRVAIWLDPFSDALGAGFQIVRGLYAFGRGGLLGTGLGAGLPSVDGSLAVPALPTDYVFAGLAEELGAAGAIALLGLYLVIAERGLRIAARAADDFRALLAAGLTLVLVLQAALIMAGDLKLVPLTGVTLPFVAYGGSSLLGSGICVGLLLALSDSGVEAPAPPPAMSRGQRLRGGGRAALGRLERAVR